MKLSQYLIKRGQLCQKVTKPLEDKEGWMKKRKHSLSFGSYCT